MAGELITKPEELVAMVSGQGGLQNVLQPLTREIHLFDSYIAGTTFIKDQELLTKLQVGDSLTLQREDNKFDDNAILILNTDRQKLGYVPEKDNLIFARLMDAGKRLTAKIKSVDRKKGFTQVRIGIYLIDF